MLIVHLLSPDRLLRPHGLQHARVPWPSLSPGLCANSWPAHSLEKTLMLGKIDGRRRRWRQRMRWLAGITDSMDMLLLLLSRFSRTDSVRPHRRQPTRLPCPWDSPGKNTGVGCHFLLQCMKVVVQMHKLKSLSRVQLLATPGTVAYQAPLSMGFSRQEYWSGLPFPSPLNGHEFEQTPGDGERQGSLACCRVAESDTTEWLNNKHVHWSQWCHLTISSSAVLSPLALSLSQHQGLFQ